MNIILKYYKLKNNFKNINSINKGKKEGYELYRNLQMMEELDNMVMLVVLDLKKIIIIIVLVKKEKKKK